MQICLIPYRDTHIYTQKHTYTHGQPIIIHTYTHVRTYVYMYIELSPYTNINIVTQYEQIFPQILWL